MREKIVTRNALIGRRDEYRQAGKIVAFTSGVFDIVHAGHVAYLEEAKTFADILVVGVNSDASVKANKGPLRPIIDEVCRAQVVAGLGCVDHVFIFDDRNNNENVALLKPDIYVKAGDYSPATLSSKKIVESYGGRVEIVPHRGALSSSLIIRAIEDQFRTVEGEAILHERRPAIFVDRDGTINEHIEYLSEPSRFREIQGSFQALKTLRDHGYRIVVVTNQPGIGLGYFTKEDFFAVNREMMRQATAVGLLIDRIYFCPHSKGDTCRCRKPAPFLIEQAVKDLNIDLANSYMIGDMTSDIELAHAARCKGVLVKTGRGGDDKLFAVQPEIVAQDLRGAAEMILTCAS